MTIKTEIKGNMLVISVDLSPAAIAAAKPSSTGKTRLIATTGAAIPVSGKGVPDGLKLQLSAYVPNA